MTSPTTGMTKNPTTPRAIPNHVVDAGMPELLSRRPGTAYLTTVPATRTAVASPNTVQAVPPPTSTAQTRTATSTRTRPGRTGTTTPTSPTRIARATTTSTRLTRSP